MVSAFDRVKEAYPVPCQMDLLINYCSIGPALAASLNADSRKESLAQLLMNTYLVPARQLSEAGLYYEAVEVYRRMVDNLKNMYQMKHQIIQRKEESSK